MQGVIYNNDRDISLVLIQIHERTLQGDSHQVRSFGNSFLEHFSKENRSFAQVLQDSSRISRKIKIPVEKSMKKEDFWKRNKLFFTNMNDDILVPEIWKIFKKFGQVKDIFFPSKRDKFGKRFGFLIPKDNVEARKLISRKEELVFNNTKIFLDWAREGSKRSFKNQSKEEHIARNTEFISS